MSYLLWKSIVKPPARSGAKPQPEMDFIAVLASKMPLV